MLTERQRKQPKLVSKQMGDERKSRDLTSQFVRRWNEIRTDLVGETTTKKCLEPYGGANHCNCEFSYALHYNGDGNLNSCQMCYCSASLCVYLQ